MMRTHESQMNPSVSQSLLTLFLSTRSESTFLRYSCMDGEPSGVIRTYSGPRGGERGEDDDVTKSMEGNIAHLVSPS